MDGQRFDLLAKTIAGGITRRTVLKLLGSAAAALTGAATLRSSGEAQSNACSTSSVSVPGTIAWTDTGIDIPAGATVDIAASGVITIAGSDPGKYPDGSTVGGSGPVIPCPLAVPQPSAACWSLIGRIDTNAPFAVGYDTSFTATDGGRLYLGVNDDTFGDNSGAWTANITVCLEGDTCSSPRVCGKDADCCPGDTCLGKRCLPITEVNLAQCLTLTLVDPAEGADCFVELGIPLSAAEVCIVTPFSAECRDLICKVDPAHCPTPIPG